MIDNVEFEDDEHALYKALEARSQLQFNKYLQKDAVACKLSLAAKASRLLYDRMLTGFQPTMQTSSYCCFGCVRPVATHI
jgi:hypothetical protein